MRMMAIMTTMVMVNLIVVCASSHTVCTTLTFTLIYIWRQLTLSTDLHTNRITHLSVRVLRVLHIAVWAVCRWIIMTQWFSWIHSHLCHNFTLVSAGILSKLVNEHRVTACMSEWVSIKFCVWESHNIKATQLGELVFMSSVILLSELHRSWNFVWASQTNHNSACESAVHMHTPQ